MVFLAIELKFDVQAIFDTDFHLDGLRRSFSIDGLNSNLHEHVQITFDPSHHTHGSLSYRQKVLNSEILFFDVIATIVSRYRQSDEVSKSNIESTSIIIIIIRE